MYCQNCGKQIPDGSTFCTECGAPQYVTPFKPYAMPIANSPKKKTGLIVALCILAAIVVSIVVNESDSVDSSHQTETATLNDSNEPIEAPISVTAADLYNQYDENEVSADRLYMDKLLQVSGVIDSVTVTFGQIQVIVTDGQDWSFIAIYCNFEDDQSDAVSALKNGDSIVIQGICRGKALTPALDNCTIIS